MTATGDWERVKQLFQEALDIAPDARVAFVKARAGDAHVFQEVMSLLETYPAAAGFLSTPPDSAQVRTVVARLQAGDELGPFRITSLIGIGGMGEVYRAWDTRLDRQVAIKVLPRSQPWMAPGASGSRPRRGHLQVDPSPHQHAIRRRLGASRQHDRAVSGDGVGRGRAWRHGSSVDLFPSSRPSRSPSSSRKRWRLPMPQASFTAMSSLRTHADAIGREAARLRPGCLRPSLVVAHAARPAGDPATRPGLFGTLPYMAPELLRGAEADARTDLFAFGATLYKMLAGRPAFAAGSEADLVLSDPRSRTGAAVHASTADTSAAGATDHDVPGRGSGRALADRARSRAGPAMGPRQSRPTCETTLGLLWCRVRQWPGVRQSPPCWVFWSRRPSGNVQPST